MKTILDDVDKLQGDIAKAQVAEGRAQEAETQEAKAVEAKAQEAKAVEGKAISALAFDEASNAWYYYEWLYRAAVLLRRHALTVKFQREPKANKVAHISLRGLFFLGGAALFAASFLFTPLVFTAVIGMFVGGLALSTIGAIGCFVSRSSGWRTLGVVGVVVGALLSGIALVVGGAALLTAALGLFSTCLLTGLALSATGVITTNRLYGEADSWNDYLGLESSLFSKGKCQNSFSRSMRQVYLSTLEGKEGRALAFDDSITFYMNATAPTTRSVIGEELKGSKMHKRIDHFEGLISANDAKVVSYPLMLEYEYASTIKNTVTRDRITAMCAFLAPKVESNASNATPLTSVHAKLSAALTALQSGLAANKGIDLELALIQLSELINTVATIYFAKKSSGICCFFKEPNAFEGYEAWGQAGGIFDSATCNDPASLFLRQTYMQTLRSRPSSYNDLETRASRAP